MILQGTIACSCEWHMELLPDPVPEIPFDALHAGWITETPEPVEPSDEWQ